MATRAESMAWLALQGVQFEAHNYLDALDDWDWDRALAGSYTDEFFDTKLKDAWKALRAAEPFRAMDSYERAFGPAWYKRKAAFRSLHYYTETQRDNQMEAMIRKACISKAGVDMSQWISPLVNVAGVWRYVRQESVDLFSAFPAIVAGSHTTLPRLPPTYDIQKALIQAAKKHVKDLAADLDADDVFLLGAQKVVRYMELEHKVSTFERRLESHFGSTVLPDITERSSTSFDSITDQELLDLVRQSDDIAARAQGLLSLRAKQRVAVDNNFRVPPDDPVKNAVDEVVGSILNIDFDRGLREVYNRMLTPGASDDVGYVPRHLLGMRVIRQMRDEHEGRLFLGKPPDPARAELSERPWSVDNNLMGAVRRWIARAEVGENYFWTLPKVVERRKFIEQVARKRLEGLTGFDEKKILEDVGLQYRRLHPRSLTDYADNRSRVHFRRGNRQHYRVLEENSVREIESEMLIAFDTFMEDMNRVESWNELTRVPHVMKGLYNIKTVAGRVQGVPLGIRRASLHSPHLSEEPTSFLEIWQELSMGVTRPGFEELKKALAAQLGPELWTPARQDAFDKMAEAALEAAETVAKWGLEVRSMSQAIAESALFRRVIERVGPFKGSESEIKRAVRGGLNELGEEGDLVDFMTKAQRKAFLRLPVQEFLRKNYRVGKAGSKTQPVFEGNAIEIAKHKARLAGKVVDKDDVADVRMVSGVEDLWKQGRLQAPDTYLLGDQQMISLKEAVDSEYEVMRRTALDGIPSLEDLEKVVADSSRYRFVVDKDGGLSVVEKLDSSNLLEVLFRSTESEKAEQVARMMIGVADSFDTLSVWQVQRFIAWRNILKPFQEVTDVWEERAMWNNLVEGLSQGRSTTAFSMRTRYGISDIDPSRSVDEPPGGWDILPGTPASEEQIANLVKVIGDKSDDLEDIDREILTFVQQRIDSGRVTDNLVQGVETYLNTLQESLERAPSARGDIINRLSSVPANYSYRFEEPSFIGQVIDRAELEDLFDRAYHVGLDHANEVRTMVWDEVGNGFYIRDDNLAVWKNFVDRVANGTVTKGQVDEVSAWVDAFTRYRNDPQYRLLLEVGGDTRFPPDLTLLHLYRDRAAAALQYQKLPRPVEEDIFFSASGSVSRAWLEVVPDFMEREIRRGVGESAEELAAFIPRFVESKQDYDLWLDIFERLDVGVLTVGQGQEVLTFKAAQALGTVDEALRKRVRKALKSGGRTSHVGRLIASRVDSQAGPNVVGPWVNEVLSGPNHRLRFPEPEVDGIPIWNQIPDLIPTENIEGVIGGSSPHGFFVDPDGNLWMIKSGIWSESELAANRLGAAVGMPVPPGKVYRLADPENPVVGSGPVIDGEVREGRYQYAFLQRLWHRSEVKSDDTWSQVTGGRTGPEQTELLERLNEQIGQNAVFEWLTGNRDLHAGNQLISLDRSRIIGIDKGAAFSRTATATTALPSLKRWLSHGDVYKAWRRGLETGEISEPDWDSIAVIVERYAALSDEAFEDAIRKAVEERIIYTIPTGRAPEEVLREIQEGHPVYVNRIREVVDYYKKLKNEGPQRFVDFVHDIQTTRGVSADDLWVPIWDRRLISTPIDEAFIEELHKVGSQGKSIVVPSSDIHGGAVHFDIVKQGNGQEVLRVQLSLRPGGAIDNLIDYAQEEEIFLASGVSAHTSGLPPGLLKEVTAQPKPTSSRVSMTEMDGPFETLEEVFAVGEPRDFRQQGQVPLNTLYDTGFTAVTQDGEAILLTGILEIPETYQGNLEIVLSPTGRLPTISLRPNFAGSFNARTRSLDFRHSGDVWDRVGVGAKPFAKDVAEEATYVSERSSGAASALTWMGRNVAPTLDPTAAGAQVLRREAIDHIINISSAMSPGTSQTRRPPQPKFYFANDRLVPKTSVVTDSTEHNEVMREWGREVGDYVKFRDGSILEVTSLRYSDDVYLSPDDVTAFTRGVKVAEAFVMARRFSEQSGAPERGVFRRHIEQVYPGSKFLDANGKEVDLDLWGDTVGHQVEFPDKTRLEIVSLSPLTGGIKAVQVVAEGGSIPGVTFDHAIFSKIYVEGNENLDNFIEFLKGTGRVGDVAGSEIDRLWTLWQTEGRTLAGRLAQLLEIDPVVKGKTISGSGRIPYAIGSNNDVEAMWGRIQNWLQAATGSGSPIGGPRFSFGFRDLINNPSIGRVAGLDPEKVLQAVISQEGDTIRVVSREMAEKMSKADLDSALVLDLLDLADPLDIPKKGFIDDLLRLMVLDTWVSPKRVGDPDDIAASFSGFTSGATRQSRMMNMNYRPFHFNSPDDRVKAESLVERSELYSIFWKAVEDGKIAIDTDALDELITNIESIQHQSLKKEFLDYANLRRQFQQYLAKTLQEDPALAAEVKKAYNISEDFILPFQVSDGGAGYTSTAQSSDPKIVFNPVAMKELFEAIGLDETLLEPAQYRYSFNDSDSPLRAWVGPNTKETGRLQPGTASYEILIPKLADIEDQFVDTYVGVGEKLRKEWYDFLETVTPGSNISPPVSTERIPVSVSHVEQGVELLRKLGIGVDNPTPENQRLIYWQLQYGQAVVNGDQRVIDAVDPLISALGTGPSATALADAIQEGFTVAGIVVRDIEEILTKPFFSHGIHGDEIGRPLYMRPGVKFVDENGVPYFRDVLMVHHTGYLFHGVEPLHWLGKGGGGGEGFLSQRAKFLMGRFDWDDPNFRLGAHNDLWVGGGNTFYARLVAANPNIDIGMGRGSPKGLVVLNPARQWAKHDTYAFAHDMDGRTISRPLQQPSDTANFVREKLTQGHNEVMIRWGITVYDDVEIAFCPTEASRDRILDWLRSEGVTEIRGVPIEERWVYMEDMEEARVYMYNFAQKYFDLNPKEL